MVDRGVGHHCFVSIPKYIPVVPRGSRPCGCLEGRRLLLICQSVPSEIEAGLNVSNLDWGEAVPDTCVPRDKFDVESKVLCASECDLDVFDIR